MQKNTGVLVFVFLLLTHFSFSQTADSTKRIAHFSGSVSVTHNGISVIPTFSLGKPATIFNLLVGKGKLSFEPELRFALEGKPWSFLFWWRYKLVNAGKFIIKIGAHPALNFKTEAVWANGVLKEEVMVTRRYLAGELAPNYFIAKNISVGMYYLYSYGLDWGTIRNTHFVTVNSNFSNIKLSKQFFMRFAPQFFYLKMDKQDGAFFTSIFTLAKKNFPLSVSSIINKRIKSNIVASKNFVWNASLIYAFNKKYIKI
jgi:hypothetical protein